MERVPLESRIQKFYDTVCNDHDYFCSELDESDQCSDQDESLEQLVIAYSSLAESLRKIFPDILYVEEI